MEQKTWLDRPSPKTVAIVIGTMAVGVAFKQPIIEWVAGTAGVVEFMTWTVNFVGVGASRTRPPHESDTDIIESEDFAEHFPE